MYGSLLDFLNTLEREGELVRINRYVDPVEEMTEIADRMAKSPGGGKALLFEETGTAFPVAMNLFGSARRMSLALGVDSLEELPMRIGGLASKALSPKGSLVEKLGVLPLLSQASQWFPKRSRRRGKCQETILLGEEARLSLLPVLKCWPHDGGRFVTLPMVNTVDPESGVPNVGMYRMQIMDDYITGMHWHMHKTGARHYEAYKRAGRRMPVSVCLGGDPVYTYSATAPLPDGIDEYLLAGFLRQKPVRLVRCVTNEIFVPDDCDFVIEGYVDPTEEKLCEGPFGDHTGFYSLEDAYPAFHVTAITHRKDAVWCATVVGVPPQEDFYISQATEKLFLAPIRLVMQPELKDMYMPCEGVAHNLVIVSMTPRYPGHVRTVVSSLWGAGQMMFDKYMVVAPAGADIRDPELLAALLRSTEMRQALIRGEGVLDILDHAAAVTGYGGKMALDLTEALSDVPTIDVPDRITPAGGVSEWDVDHLSEWGVVVLYAEPGACVDAAAFLAANRINAKIAVIVDRAAQALHGGELLWLALGNTDASRDVVLSDGVIVADARTKLAGREDYPVRFPNVVTSSEAVIALVDSRWSEYGIGDFIASPSLRYRRLLRSDKAEV